MHDHCDHHLPAPDRSESAKALRKSLVLIIIFMIIEFLGGLYANSLALITDALHMFTDAGAVMLSLFAFWIAKKPGNPKWSYGFHRAEIVGALISASSTWILAGILIYEAIERLYHPEAVKGPIMLVIAAIGLISNVVMMRILHPAQSSNLNVRGAYVHILGDLLGSIGVVLAAILLWITKWNPIDPIVTMIFSMLVLHSAWKLIKETIQILMEAAPMGVDPKKVKEDLENIEGVASIHDLHIWMLSSGMTLLTAHITSSDPDNALSLTHEMLSKKHQIKHSTIQVEHINGTFSKECRQNCLS